MKNIYLIFILALFFNGCGDSVEKHTQDEIKHYAKCKNTPNSEWCRKNRIDLKKRWEALTSK